MYQINDLVVYGIHGVCRIEDIVWRIVDRKEKEYYVLTPLHHGESKYYIPTQNQAAVGKISPVLSKAELEELLYSNRIEQGHWIDDENKRKQQYRLLISSGNRAQLLSMVGVLYRHRDKMLQQGRKFHLCDENFLRDAEKLLSCEFSLVLGISQNEVSQYIKNVLGIE